VVQGSVETGRTTRDVSISGLLDPLEGDNFICIKGGLVQEWTQFAKQQHRHGLQGKRSERRARVSNSRASSYSVLYLILMDPCTVDYSVEIPTRCSFVM
jgi:hypothetical protein